MSDKTHGFGKLDDNQVDELRNQLRDFVSGTKDPGASFLETLISGHSLHTSNHGNTAQDQSGQS